MWDQLTPQDRNLLTKNATRRTVTSGTLLHNGSADCLGLLAIISGRLRAYILSEEGRELTIYRLFERDICLFSASCIMQSIQFDITIEAEKDSAMWVVPSEIYKEVMGRSAALANYTNQLMATRFSEVMWLIEQIMWKRQDKRLAGFLLNESELENTTVLKITHDRIASHLGTMREVVTRLLRYLQSEGMVRLSRGTVELADLEKLRELAEDD